MTRKHRFDLLSKPRWLLRSPWCSCSPSCAALYSAGDLHSSFRSSILFTYSMMPCADNRRTSHSAFAAPIRSAIITDLHSHPEPYVRSAFYTSWSAATYRPSVFKNSMSFEFMVVMTENFFYGFAGTKKRRLNFVSSAVFFMGVLLLGFIPATSRVRMQTSSQ